MKEWTSWSDADYKQGLARLDILMTEKIEHGSPASPEYLRLVRDIGEYERATYGPIGLPDPVDAIEFRIDQMGLSQKDLIPFLGSASRVSEVLARKRPLTLSMIRRLHRGLGIPAEVLIGEYKKGASAVAEKRPRYHTRRRKVSSRP